MYSGRKSHRIGDFNLDEKFLQVNKSHDIASQSTTKNQCQMHMTPDDAKIWYLYDI